MQRFHSNSNIPTRIGFGKGLVKAGKKNDQILILGADITNSVNLNYFKEAYPERFISLGIAEQNCVGVAAGLALDNKVPVFSTYGVFAALRPIDQIRVSVCYNNLHVIIGGAHAGISVGPDGATHQALEDIALMRALPNMTVLSPCDATQTELATIAAIEKHNGPVYIRFGREAVPDFTDPNLPFKIGKAQLLKTGDDLTIIATGHMVWEALQSAYQLQDKGIHARVLNMHTIKPIDKEAIIQAAIETGGIVTAEEHQLIGGLGSAVAEIVVQNKAVPMEFVGMKNQFGESGKPDELLQKYQMTQKDILKKAISLFNKKKFSPIKEEIIDNQN